MSRNSEAGSASCSGTRKDFRATVARPWERSRIATGLESPAGSSVSAPLDRAGSTRSTTDGLRSILPTRIHTLGPFDIVGGDARIALSGKVQRKPIELLKVLIALGGRAVAAERLIGVLWPEPPEDGGHKALEIAVHRLRMLLGQRGALTVSGRHVSIDARCVWVDALWLDEWLASLLASEPGPQPDLPEMERFAGQVLLLYRGHFLAQDVEAPWQIPLRNRLCGRMQRFVLRLGERLEDARGWQRAAELYQRVIELDPLAEAFYRRQIVCLNRLGHRVEAIEVFRRLRHTLSVLLGVAPSAETMAVHAQSWRGPPPPLHAEHEGSSERQASFLDSVGHR